MTTIERDWPAAFDRRDLQDRRLLAATAALIVALVVLRVVLGRYPLWFDELASLVLADQPLPHLWGRWMVNETNPPLFYTLLKGWQALGFHGTIGLRLLPELGAAIELALLAIAARVGWGRKAAVTAVLLAGFSAQHVYAGQLLRGYIFGADGVLLALIGLLLVLRRPERMRPGLLLYGLGSVLAIHCHTTLLLWPPAAMAGLLCARPALLRGADRPLLAGLLAAHLAILAASAWWLTITLEQVRAGSSNIAWIQSLPLDQYGDLLLRTVMLVNQLYKVERIGVLVVCAALLWAAWLTRRQPAARLVLGAGTTGALALGLISLVHPIATLMTPFWLSPLVVLVIAGGVEALPGDGAAAALRLPVLAVLVLNLFAHGSQLTAQDFAGAVRTAAAHPGAALLVEHRSLGAVTAKACELEFAGQACPVPIIAIVMPREVQTWAEPVPGVRYVAPEALPAALHCCAAVFAIRTLEHDPLLHLGIKPAASRLAWNEPFIEGPIPSTRFAEARFRVDPQPYATTNPAM